MIVGSRWFPAAFAVFQTARHIGLIGYEYWRAARYEERFDAGQYIREDLARPFFENVGFCLGWASYRGPTAANQAIDFPAYLLAAAFHSAVNQASVCMDTLTRPRGQILVAAFVPAVWVAAGFGLRRLALGRWRKPASNRFLRVLACLGLTPFALGAPLALAGVVAAFTADLWLVLRLWGYAFWFLYVVALSAERLRIWPFERASLRIDACGGE